MVAITVTKEDLETLFVRLQVTGLTVGTRYDVYRLQVRYHEEDTGPVYDRELPDRRGVWSAVAHRVGWAAPAATANFRDYECPRRPTRYFVVPSSSVGPFEYNWDNGDYPLSRGVLSTEVVHFNRDLAVLLGTPPDNDHHIIIRSTQELSLYVDLCVMEMDGPTYTARGTENAVIGTQFPVYVADTREARRGTLTLMTKQIGQYNDLRRICYPASGRIRPVIFHAGDDMLLDDVRCIPLDVTVEQATPNNPDWRYVHIDYVEVDPSAPLVHRSGDNDTLVSEPQANFTWTPANPDRGDWVTFHDTSTGLGDDWDWSFSPRPDSNRHGKAWSQGDHKVRWNSRGTKTVKLRFGGSGAGYHTRTKTLTVS